ncbi:DnaJ-like protein [Crenothrix polyspora]|uniref:DnaJ-like protein n=1 Tax=Crenothrix polyspora TaxID=360316 RepID=A0A1R4GZU8_9GAMM|nr:hypothetical protein [Crenothrix polyspora]SJM89472.1 DnaJ-like protein [Crenothrix polyspora]
MTQANKIIHIAPKAQDKTLSAAQKLFNSLSKKIDLQKKALLAWKEALPVYRQKSEQEFNPLVDRFYQHQLEWAQHLDQYYDDPSIKTADKAKIKHLIAEVCEQLIGAMNTDAVKALFNKYSDEDYDTATGEVDAALGEMMKNMAKNMFNIDLGDDIDISSPENFQAHLHEKMREHQETQARPKIERKKTKTQLAKEARQQEEEALASKSVQEVYRKLVAVLHPDREPDAQERQRKTELMQRVNIAYGKKDLLQLLELQLEIEQIDATQINQMADSRLKYFNKILKDQLSELVQEIYQIEEVSRLQCNMPFYGKISPAQLLLKLANDMRDVQKDIKAIKKELALFEQPDAFKAWLKKYKIPKNTYQNNYDDLFMDDFPFNF